MVKGSSTSITVPSAFVDTVVCEMVPSSLGFKGKLMARADNNNKKLIRAA